MNAGKLLQIMKRGGYVLKHGGIRIILKGYDELHGGVYLLQRILPQGPATPFLSNLIV